jgi:hypothetical protein
MSFRECSADLIRLHRERFHLEITENAIYVGSTLAPTETLFETVEGENFPNTSNRK